MRNLISGEDKFNELKLLRDVFAGALFVLEGTTDCTVMDNFVDPATCRTIPALSKENVIDAVSFAKDRGLAGVIGLVDADFDRLDKRVPASTNICVTDFHDLDLTILLSGVLERMLPQYCDAAKHTALLKAAGRTTLLEVLLESASVIGGLRWLSEKQRLSLNFQALSFVIFVDKPSLATIQSELIRTVISNTRSCRATASSLAGDMYKTAAAKPDPRQIANGHDVIEILSIALRFTVAHCKPDVVEPRNIEKMCRMAFAASDLKSTVVYSCIKSWEGRNPPYRVLRV